MKRKPQAKAETVIAPEIIEGAKRAAGTDRNKPKLAPPVVKCVVCGSETAPGSVEQLCWVCRRLKISAWKDLDHQLPAQE